MNNQNRNRKPLWKNYLTKKNQKNRTLYLTNKDLNTILLELIEEGVQINKVTIATELATEENQKKRKPTKN